MMRIYGIPNCSTVKKARAWLADNGYVAEFVDFKKTPPTPAQVQGWLAQMPLAALLNRKSATWRGLSAEDQAAAADADAAVALMCTHPSLIKRPVLETADSVRAGFDEAQYRAVLARQGGGA